MSTPVRVAFCPVLWGANGGQFTERGIPVCTSDGVLGSCSRAFDCGVCPYLSRWVDWLVSSGRYSVGWECDQCLKDTRDPDREDRTERILPGYYQSGRADDPDDPPLSGCTRCGWQSSFLQLVLRRKGGSQ